MSDLASINAIMPTVGATYVDERGRELEITAVQPGDHLGREVLGLLSHSPQNGHRPREYSTDLQIFAATWRAA